ncbi:MAG: NAD(P)H-dependent oxidoreductase subunit E [Planctomycetes bacterium]|nr:NAD(P)H-dependent oxidoreductase subunit E [Planctomycetota bacterium]
MDLHLIPGAFATDVEREAVDRAIGPAPARHLLLPALLAAQERAGWITPGAMNYISRRLDVPPADAYAVASFYALLSTEPGPDRVVHVCDDVVCRGKGAKELRTELERKGVACRASPCLGQCDRGPAALFQVTGDGVWELAPASAREIVDGRRGTPAPLVYPGTLLARVGRVDPESLDAYRASGGFLALQRAKELGPEGVIREILDSKLVGRGGAAFPAGKKWDAVAQAPDRPHYVVANADESEPGTFKDRVLMEGDPFSVIESISIAGYATGSEKGWIYVRGEYPLAADRLSGAIRQARARGLIGDGFDIEVRRGAGAYICGEETALFNSIEGFRGEPRNKPPFPTVRGLFGKPTLVNNVETLANASRIVLEGGPAFSASETKLFSVSGSVDRPGVYEVPLGTTLRELLERAGARRVQAVLLGGAAGSFVTPGELDVPLTFEGVRSIGASLGSGAVIVFDDRADLREIVLRIAAFFRDESCGQCVPCRVGTQRQEEALHRMALGGRERACATPDEDFALLEEIARAMGDASICGLGQTASSAALSAVRKLGVFGARA